MYLVLWQVWIFSRFIFVTVSIFAGIYHYMVLCRAVLCMDFAFAVNSFVIIPSLIYGGTASILPSIILCCWPILCRELTSYVFLCIFIVMLSSVVSLSLFYDSQHYVSVGVWMVKFGVFVPVNIPHQRKSWWTEYYISKILKRLVFMLYG